MAILTNRDVLAVNQDPLGRTYESDQHPAMFVQSSDPMRDLLAKGVAPGLE